MAEEFSYLPLVNSDMAFGGQSPSYNAGDSSSYWDNLNLDGFLGSSDPSAYSYSSSSSSASPKDNDWWDSVWDWANTDTGSSVISGSITGILKGLELSSESSLNESRMDYMDEQIELEREKLGILHGQLELERDKLEDTQTTRAKHNETINEGPQRTRTIKRISE